MLIRRLTLRTLRADHPYAQHRSNANAPWECTSQGYNSYRQTAGSNLHVTSGYCKFRNSNRSKPSPRSCSNKIRLASASRNQLNAVVEMG